MRNSRFAPSLSSPASAGEVSSNAKRCETEGARSARNASKGAAPSTASGGPPPPLRSAARGRNLHLDHFIPYRLSVLSNRVSNAIARQYSERFGLSIPEWRVMAVLGGTPGLSAREVAMRTEMDKVQVSRAVANLARTKRVQRQTDMADARVTRLSLSAKGRAIYDEIVPLALELEAQFLEALSPEERAAFDRLLVKLARQARLLGV